MIRCGILEDNDAAMARFRGGLNREIQDILDYKEGMFKTTEMRQPLCILSPSFSFFFVSIFLT